MKDIGIKKNKGNSMKEKKEKAKILLVLDPELLAQFKAFCKLKKSNVNAEIRKYMLAVTSGKTKT